MQHVWGTSWGVTTRLIGGVIMTHGDDSGLVLPPAVAPYQVVIVPIGRENWRETVLPRAKEIQQELVDAGIRVTLDERDERRAGNSPSGRCAACRCGSRSGPRTSRSRQVLHRAARHAREAGRADGRPAGASCANCWTTIQRTLLERARRRSARNTRTRVDDYDASRQAMEGRPGFVIAPWCGCRRLRSADQDRYPGDDPQHAARWRRAVRAVRPLRQAAVAEAWFAKSY